MVAGDVTFSSGSYKLNDITGMTDFIESLSKTFSGAKVITIPDAGNQRIVIGVMEGDKYA